MNARLAATTFLAAGALILAMRSCTKDPLDVSCKSFMTKSNSEQFELAARWTDPIRKTVSVMHRVVARRYANDLRELLASAVAKRGRIQMSHAKKAAGL
jgi:hypothetical protein